MATEKNQGDYRQLTEYSLDFLLIRNIKVEKMCCSNCDVSYSDFCFSVFDHMTLVRNEQLIQTG